MARENLERLRIGARQQTVFIVNTLVVGIPFTITFHFMDGCKVRTRRHCHQIRIIYRCAIRMESLPQTILHVLVFQLVKVSYGRPASLAIDSVLILTIVWLIL